VSKIDKYKPKKSGIFSVYGDKFVKGKPEQQWSFDAKAKHIHSLSFPSKPLYEDASKHLFVYKEAKPRNKLFAINTEDASIVELVTNHTLSLGKKDYALTGKTGAVSTAW
jgi:hypothetical protein